MVEASGNHLELLYRISQTINSTLDLDQVMETLMDEVIAATQAERGFLMLYDTDRQLTFRTARGMDQRTIEDGEFNISRTIVDRVASQGISLLTSNAQADDRLDQRASVRLYGLRSVLCAPIRMKQQVLGVIYVDTGNPEDAVRLFCAMMKMAEVQGYHLDSTDQWEIRQCMNQLDQMMDHDLKNRLMEEGKKLPFHDTILLAEKDHANQ